MICFAFTPFADHCCCSDGFCVSNSVSLYNNFDMRNLCEESSCDTFFLKKKSSCDNLYIFSWDLLSSFIFIRFFKVGSLQQCCRITCQQLTRVPFHQEQRNWKVVLHHPLVFFIFWSWMFSFKFHLAVFQARTLLAWHIVMLKLYQ